jgi:hypothetical protein
MDAGWMPCGCYVDARYNLRCLIDNRGDLWYTNARLNKIFNRCGCQLAYLTNAGGKCRGKMPGTNAGANARRPEE